LADTWKILSIRKVGLVERFFVYRTHEAEVVNKATGHSLKVRFYIFDDDKTLDDVKNRIRRKIQERLEAEKPKKTLALESLIGSEVAG